VSLPGARVIDVTDPTGDDNGPGTYAYPTDAVFVPGAFDLTRFQVTETGTQVYIQATIKNLVNTFGSSFGAQLLDIYVHNPAATSTSTTAAYANMNYGIAAADAWSQRLEVQGFASPIWVGPSDAPLGNAQFVVDDASGTATLILPQATFGAPGPGWVFTAALTGQGADQPPDRAFTQPAQGFTFGVCRSGVSSPICALDPNSVPKVMDTIPPTGVSQATELDPTQGPVQLQGVSP
jgi:glucoamylase